MSQTDPIESVATGICQLSGTRPRAIGPVGMCLLALLFGSIISAPAQSKPPTETKSQPATKSGLLKPKEAPVTPTPAPAPQPVDEQSPNPLVIPLPDVAARSQELTETLNQIANTMPPHDDLSEMNIDISERQPDLDAKHREVETLLQGAPNVLEIREEENYWRGMQAYSSQWRKQLLDWANTAQAAIQQLNLQEPQWIATRQADANIGGFEPVVKVIDDNLTRLRTLRSQLQQQLALIVNMQIRIGAQDQTALGILERLNKARLQSNGHLLQRDSVPLWKIFLRRQVGEVPGLFQTPASRWIAIQAFLVENVVPLVMLVVLGILTTVGAYRLSRATRQRKPSTDTEAKAFAILRHWFAAGILPPLLVGYIVASNLPTPLIGILILLSLIPILQLLPPLIPQSFRKILYFIAGFYVVNALLAWSQLSAVHRRELQFVVAAIVCGVFAYLVRPSRVAPMPRENRAVRLTVLGVRIAVASLVVALVANVFGYVRLSILITITCAYSVFIAIAIFTGQRVFTILLTAGLESQAGERLAMVRHHRQAIARWMPRLLEWTSFAVWLAASLDLMGAREAVVRWISDLLGAKIAGSSSDITLGGVLGFFLILVGGYVLSSALRFILREEVLSRLRLARGVPEVISTMLHYLVLVLVFFAAANAGGVELNKFTLLTGALGVGVGFGLQNIINNFVSGLILQFERPIHLGDVLELEPGVAGTVTRIGIRSSTILTAQGAEIIIPNANLISNRVTNWTLTEAQRRVELQVGVAYGSDLKQVMQLLSHAAATHESVLTQPPPVAYFKEFAESSLNFELQFWVMIESNWVRVKSEVSMAVVRAFEKAGIEIPFPQRDLHLRSADLASGALLFPNGSEPVAIPTAPESDKGSGTATAFRASVDR